MNINQPKIDVYKYPFFTISNVYLHIYTMDVPISTIRAWTVGQRNMKPIIKIAQRKPPLLSFVNLVEVYVLAAMRKKFEISMQKIRVSLDYVRKELLMKSQHPLAEYDFKTDGINLFLEHYGKLINLTNSGQIAMEIMEKYLTRIEYGYLGLPEKLYPFTTRDEERSMRVITINPKICFGLPILDRIGTPVSTIAERLWAGEASQKLIKEYDISQEEFDEAIRVGSLYRKAA